MAEASKIEWTDATFNPWIGCQKVSPGCDHCYAEAMMADRYGRVEWGPHGARSRTSAAYWRQPRKWNRDAEIAKAVRRPRVFCASLADVFDNHRTVLPEWRADLWALIRATPNLDWLLLTKRPQNIRKMLPEDWGDGWRNVWLGTTAENQVEADRRIPHLLSIPAAVRFLSVEPLLGPVDLTGPDMEGPFHNGTPTLQQIEADQTGWRVVRYGASRIDWVICGGESGQHARPMDAQWARGLRDQCAAASVPFFMKQMGGPRKPFPPIPDDLMVREFPL